MPISFLLQVTSQTTNPNKINLNSGKNLSNKSNNYSNIINSLSNNGTVTRRPQVFYQPQQQNHFNYLDSTTNKYLTTTRKIIRLPDSIIIYNNSRPLETLDVNKVTSEINPLSETSLLNNNDSKNNNDRNYILENSENNQKLTTKDNTVASLVNNNSYNNIVYNKSADLNSNSLLEDSLKNSTLTSSKRNDKKRNETRRPRVIRDWFLSLWDNLRSQGNAGGGGTT